MHLQPGHQIRSSGLFCQEKAEMVNLFLLCPIVHKILTYVVFESALKQPEPQRALKKNFRTSTLKDRILASAGRVIVTNDLGPDSSLRLHSPQYCNKGGVSRSGVS